MIFAISNQTKLDVKEKFLVPRLIIN